MNISYGLIMLVKQHGSGTDSFWTKFYSTNNQTKDKIYLDKLLDNLLPDI